MAAHLCCLGGPPMEKMPSSSKHSPDSRRSNRGSIVMDSTSVIVERQPCRMTFVFDPAGCMLYCWLGIVCVAFLYNVWVISYRFAFNEINELSAGFWLPIDYTADSVYLLDLLIGFRTGFFKDGVLQTRPEAIRKNFTSTLAFYLDCLALLPLDILYLSFGYCSLLRCIRLVKIWKFCNFIDITERHTNHPYSFRALILLNYVLLTFHWNACLLQIVGLQNQGTNHTELSMYGGSDSNKTMAGSLNYYLTAYSHSCSCLLLLSQKPLIVNADEPPSSTLVTCVSIGEQLVGLFLYASVIAYFTNIVVNRSSDKKKFQNDLDSVKEYMQLRAVPTYLQAKVIRWFDYLWRCKGKGNDSIVLDCLPDRMKAEIAIQVHLDVLKQVKIFRNTEPGFLCDLVLRLQPMLFSPGDYVCRRGEVGKQMYIVDHGRLTVMNDDTGEVLVTLMAGTYFGEISLLNIGDEGNRRTASVVSVGYTQLLCLSKKDMWEVLEDYPNARERLEEIARKRLVQVRQAGHRDSPCKPSLTVDNKPYLDRSESWRRRSAPASIVNRVERDC